ncbi:hypothetical protein O0I10_010578 [Lichtheimia ornata]|uniref:Phosphatidylglycerol/phosphatidylinositol transfer protein n=1 Tax=Lichtheimia ornata TaxID=688661 RepID=A0AAD7XR76_9FUNG|nr:uncharacterized protein O0I10_010578 [Lichtheimia ornata]KAJ8653779.1 hypothetical protein O0I10_010578 [Lichtheimia ornata]
MRLHFLSLVAMATVVIGHPIQQPFMSPERHGEIWSLCDDPSSHLLRAYEDGVYISPATPHAGQDINVRINGNLLSEVTGGKVSIDLNLLSMIKVQKDLDLCNVLESDIIKGDLSCPLPAGDLVLEALAFIPKEIPRLPLDGRIRISDQSDQTVTCIHLNFNLQ